MNNYFFGNKDNTKAIVINSIAVLAVVILLVIFMSLTNHIFASGYSKEELEPFESNENVIDITEILSKNTEKIKRQEVSISEREIDFTTVHRVNDTLPKDEIKLVQRGKKGREQIYVKKVFEGDTLIEEAIIANHIVEGPVAEIKEIGTLESSTLKITQVPSTSNTYENRKAEAFSKLGFDMDLREHSGLTFDDFVKIASNDERDRNNAIADNVETFYAMEQKYNINGIFLMALAIHESGWGTSSIAKDKNNLFGYGSYDRDPYNSSYNFDSYAEGIELVSRALVRNYLNKSGTPIYEGQAATGSFYNGPNLAGINVKYATDPEWAIKVFRLMEYLYGRL